MAPSSCQEYTDKCVPSPDKTQFKEDPGCKLDFSRVVGKSCSDNDEDNADDDSEEAEDDEEETSAENDDNDADEIDDDNETKDKNEEDWKTEKSENIILITILIVYLFLLILWKEKTKYWYTV